MSVDGLGSTLLREVKVEGLDELLRTLRYTHEIKHGLLFTGQTIIDRLLEAFVHSDTTGPQHNIPPNAAPALSIDHGRIRSHQVPVLELVGTSSCSGKTQLLYHLVALSLLPSEHDGVSLDGRSSAVILFDLGNNFSIIRLRNIMMNYVQSSVGARSEPTCMETIDRLVRSSLEHLYVFRPQSSLSLLATLSGLQSYIFDTVSHVSANRQVGSVILHDLDAFLWQDRLEDAEDQTHDGRTLQKTTLLSSRFRDMVAHLRRLQTDFSCLIMATSSALSTTTYTRIEGLMMPTLPSHLPNAWKSIVTVRLVVQRDSVRKFPLGVSAEEAAREAGQRREAVEKSVFLARLDWSQSDNWKEETRNTIKALGEGWQFPFKVTASGVEFKIED
ncbi:MAG: hypothetical protein Q9225_006619 [Loekoesia sp. 1 TL-2023]